MHLRPIRYFFGIAGFLAQASTVPHQEGLDQMSPRAVSNPLDLKSEHSAKQSAGPADYSDLMMVERADGGIDIVERPKSEPQSEPQREPHSDTLVSLAKRWSLLSEVCRQFSTSRCEFEMESSRCIDDHNFQVYCAGCYNVNHGRGQQKPGKQACHPKMTCVDSRFVNVWKENRESILCLPTAQVVKFQAYTPNSRPVDIYACSPGLTNTAGRDVKVELTVDSYDSGGQYLINPRSSTLNLNGKVVDTALHEAHFAIDLTLRRGSSAQGCLTTIGSLYQKLQGKFSVSFAF